MTIADPTATAQTTPAQEAAPVDAQALWNEVAGQRESTQEAGASVEFEASAAVAAQQAEDAAKPEDAAVVETTTTTTEPDPFAGLSPAVVARLQQFDAMQAQLGLLPQLQTSLREAQGRVSAMQRELAQARAAAATVPAAPTQAQIAAAAKSTEKWDSLKTDFPDWADATEEYVKASLAGLTPQQTAGLTPEDVETRIATRLAAAKREAEHERVGESHPGWQQTVNAPEFKTWFAAQDANTRALAASERARDAIAVLDLFQRAKQSPADTVAAERQSRLSAAATTKPAAAAAVAKTPDQMTPAELWEFERKNATKRNTSGLPY